MKTTIEVNLKPFPLPDCAFEARFRVVEKEDPDGGLKIPLNKLDSYTLNKMCENFKMDVFAKAGATHLPRQAPCPNNINEALDNVPGLHDAVMGLLGALNDIISKHDCGTAKAALRNWDEARMK